MPDSSNKMHVTDGSFAIGNTQQHIDNQTIENQVVNNYLTQPQSDEKKPERIITCGDYDKALEHYKKALVIVEKVLDPEHPSTAATYNNIALFYRAKGDYDKALEYSKKDLAISEAVLGPNHPDTRITYLTIAGIYSAMGNEKKEREYILKFKGLPG